MEHPPARLRLWLRRTLIVVGAGVALLGVAVIAEHHLKGPLLHFVSARSQHPISAATVEVHLLSRHPRIEARQLSIGNPPWSPPGVVARIDRLSLQLRWRATLPLLTIERLEVERADLHLLRDEQTRANWYLREEGPGEGPPLIRSLSVPAAHVELQDARRHLRFTGTVSVGDAQATAVAPPLRLHAEGELNGRPVTLRIDGEPLATVQPDRAYHFSFEERSSGARLSGAGYFVRPFDSRRMEESFAASGRNLRDAYYLVGLKLPNTGTFSAVGRVSREDKRFTYSELAGRFGASDIGGTLRVDSSNGRPRVEGELSSHRLRLRDIGARAAGEKTAAASADGPLIPETPLPLQGIRRGDIRVSYRAQQLEAGGQDLQGVSGVVNIDRGALRIERLRAALAGGTLLGRARFDAAGETPRADLDVKADSVQLDQLHLRGGAVGLSGPLSGRVQVSGVGSSLHALAASANGTLTIVVPGGAMRASVAQLGSLDVGGALGVLRKSDTQTGVRCAVANLDVQQGVVNVRTLVLDTDAALLTGSGAVHLDSESLELLVRGRPKRPTLALRSTISVTGTLRHPAVRLVQRGVLAQTAAAVALGAVLTPLASVLAFVDPGLAHNADCAPLEADVSTRSAVAPASAPATAR